jgi:hypothetical protein
MIAYRELVTPATPYSPALYRMVECKEAEVLARFNARLQADIESPEDEPANAAAR